MDLYSPNDNLDIHQCPRCKWSFSHRIPRTLDCNHSFYFCENCLRRKQQVQCGLCGHITKTTQILSPARARGDAANHSRHAQHSFSMFTSPHNNNNNKENQQSNNHETFTALPTQIESSHTVRRGSPTRHQQHSTSEPIKNQLQNANTKGQRFAFERDEIINLQNEIERLKSQLFVATQQQQHTSSQHSSSSNQGADVEQMKQQMLQLMLENERLNKQCASLTQQTELQQQQIHALHDKLLPLKLECTNLRTHLMRHKHEIFHNALTPLKDYVEQSMRSLLQQHTQTVTEYNREVQLRRKYFNLIQNFKGNIRIYCRIRPLLPDEIERSYTAKVQSLSKQKLVVEVSHDKTDKIEKKAFEFDRVFSSIATQDDVFEEVNELIISVMDGYNVCLFAYGQTGSGKTYTMEGVNQRAIQRLFTVTQQRQRSYEYHISVSMVEIYNEKIKDLLCVQNKWNPDEKDLKKQGQPVYLNLRGNDKTGMYIDDLSEMKCTSIQDVCTALNRGYDNRSVGVTDANLQSSRSHSILTINVKALHTKSGGRYASKLNLIDLAGSERVKLSNAAGERLKEAQSINRSLSCLGNVLMAIKDKKSYVPYRDSVLTLILKDSIGNNAKTAMFCNVSSCSKDLDQTSISLTFASKLKNVCMVKAKIKPRREN